MTPKDLLAALSALGWSRAELGRRIDVHANTVSGWTTGAHPIPGAVAAYLRLAVSVKGLLA